MLYGNPDFEGAQAETEIRAQLEVAPPFNAVPLETLVV